MRPLTLGSTFARPFTLSDAPDALPVVKVYAGETYLGDATVALTGSTINRYLATYTLPGSGITAGTNILMRVDWELDAVDQPSVDLFAGYIAPGEVAHVADLPPAPDNAGIAAALTKATSADDRTSLIYTLLQLTDADVASLINRVTGVVRTATEDATAESAQTSAIRDGLATSQEVTDAAQSVITHGDGAGDWGAVGSGGGGGDSLTGDYVFTVTVIDSVTEAPIEAARVRAFRAGKDGTLPTDEDGVAEVPVDGATYKIVIAADNYQTLIVDRSFSGDAAETFELTLQAISPAATDTTFNVAVDVITQHGGRPNDAVVWAVPTEALPNAFSSLVVTDDNKFTTTSGRAIVPLLKNKPMTIHVEFNSIVKKLPFTATADGQVATVTI